MFYHKGNDKNENNAIGFMLKINTYYILANPKPVGRINRNNNHTLGCVIVRDLFFFSPKKQTILINEKC